MPTIRIKSKEDTRFLSTGVFERSGSDTMSRRVFYLLMGNLTLAALLLTTLVAYSTSGWVHLNPETKKMVCDGTLPLWIISIGALVISLIGVVMTKLENPVLSLLGFALIAGPFGVILGPTVALYTTASVVKGVLLTGVVVTAFGAIGFLIPQSLESWASWVLGGLLIAILGQLGIPLIAHFDPTFPLQGALTFWDWVVLVLFSGIIVFDMNRAAHIPATFLNAVDSAVELYLDIINVFVRILSIIGQRKDD